MTIFERLVAKIEFWDMNYSQNEFICKLMSFLQEIMSIKVEYMQRYYFSTVIGQNIIFFCSFNSHKKHFKKYIYLTLKNRNEN